MGKTNQIIIERNSKNENIAHTRVLKIINDTEQKSKHIKHISKIMKTRSSLSFTSGPPPKGGRRPSAATPLWEFCKGKGWHVFIIFDIFLIYFDIFSISFILFRTLVCAMLFLVFIFVLFWVSLFFNDLIIFRGCVKLISLAWRLMWWVNSINYHHAITQWWLSLHWWLINHFPGYLLLSAALLSKLII